jgi:hypothetical protein
MFKMLFVGAILHHISKSSPKVRVVDVSMLQFEFETNVHPNEECIFPSLQQTTNMSTKIQTTR